MSPWLKVDERFSRGLKVKRAALELGGGKRNRARVLAVWVDAMSYCNLQLTNGLFPDHEMDDLPDHKPLEVFTAMAIGDAELGAIVERDDRRKGWVFRNYADYQQTKEEVESKKENDRLRKRFQRSSTASPRGQKEDSDHTDPIRTDPIRTDPIRTDSNTEGSAVLAFPTHGKPRVWHLTQPQIAEWQGLYPALDILAQCRSALAWCLANPAKQKTSRGMPAFLVRWLTRATDSGHVNGHARPAVRVVSPHTQAMHDRANEQKRIQADIRAEKERA